MKPVRVLYCNGGKLDYGGVTAVMLNYASRFDRREVQVDFLVHGSEKGPREDEAAALGARIIHVPYKVPHYFRNRRAILDACRGYDIVHAHMDGMNGYVLALAKRAGVPERISHCHNTQFLTTNPLRVFLHRRTANRIPRVATRLFACSEDAGRFLYGNALVDAGRVRIVQNAIILERFRFSADKRASARAALGIPDDRFVIGHIGRFDYQKNQSFFLPLLQRVHAENNTVELVLVGNGASREALQQEAAATGLKSCVHFAGFTDDIPAMLSAFDIFALPSRFEGLGIVLIEAQASGLPCVASADVPAATRVTDCRYVPLSDPDGWAHAILTAKRKTGAERSVDFAPFIKAGYDIDTEAKKLQDYYRELVP